MDSNKDTIEVITVFDGFGNRRITAVTSMREVSPFQDMNVHRVQSAPPLLEAYISDSDEPSIVRGGLDWSHLPGYELLPDSATHAVIYHYTLNGVDVNKIFKPPQEHVRFPPGTIVFREKESVTLWYGEFLRGILSETDWRGGMFDVLPGMHGPTWWDRPLDSSRLPM